ncbi:hypothetical protein GBAR_LOCUS31670, partial [Geodia barretti]
MFFGALLAAQAVTGLPTRDDGLPGHVRQRRATPEAERVIEGLNYAKHMMLAPCYQPGILPEVSGSNIKKIDCTSDEIVTSQTYVQLIAALDKVLRLYDLQQQLGNESMETSALKIVIDTVVNQTCEWIESLGIQFNSSSETVTCYSSHSIPMAQIKKLRVLVSTYQLVNSAHSSTESAVGHALGLNRAGWMSQSGIEQGLTKLLNNTDYSVHLLPMP